MERRKVAILHEHTVPVFATSSSRSDACDLQAAATMTPSSLVAAISAVASVAITNFSVIDAPEYVHKFALNFIILSNWNRWVGGGT